MDPVANPFRSVNDVPTRARALDAMRGAAVLAMIAWHVADAWLAPSFRSGPAWHAVRVVGGLAAPLFLYAAGANVARAIAAGATIGDVARRGGEVFALGILLRAQIWAVDAGGLSEPRAWPAIVALGGGAALTVGAARASRHDADGIASRWLRDVPWIVGPLLFVIGAAIVIVDHPERCSLALRFDALHCVGAS
ncbi:MAG: heparan-alpha-glucosaminide N-acetyltransferase domain-containing protein, partial [Sandaracinaceae bacterium]